ncbi:hypothetical protein R1flu_001698 [Riccia fluitans]|uniref:Uncharacterized protein n=1 Tax=Riccia fluitans TaxID=41844 RepID=A0ABD1Y3Z8_9MARC
MDRHQPERSVLRLNLEEVTLVYCRYIYEKMSFAAAPLSGSVCAFQGHGLLLAILADSRNTFGSRKTSFPERIAAATRLLNFCWYRIAGFTRDQSQSRKTEPCNEVAARRRRENLIDGSTANGSGVFLANTTIRTLPELTSGSQFYKPHQSVRVTGVLESLTIETG